MAEEIDARIVQEFARDIAGMLNEAAIIAKLADGFGRQGPGASVPIASRNGAADP